MANAYNCEQARNEAGCDPKKRFGQAFVKHIGLVVSFVMKILALITAINTRNELETVRKDAGLGTFDNCCNRITNLEVDCLFS